MRFAYNWLVDEPFKPSPPGKRAAEAHTLSAERRRALRAETIGLIVIAVAIVVYAILRYGTHINWSTR